MLVSYAWLNEFVDLPNDPRELAERWDLTGTAVESVTDAGEHLKGIVVGHILTREKHPDADRLWVTTVDIGTSEPLQIVCGAQNFVAGDKVPVATVGTVMPNGMKIKKSKLRGVVSAGMNCSGAELGLTEDSDGLLILPADAPIGMPFAEYQGLADTIFDLEITPNRPDCLSIIGVARETGAVYDKPVSYPSRPLTEGAVPASSLASVVIEDPQLCPRYTARIIRGAKVGPSPSWVTQRLKACGIRPINNVVDATNYVLLELGQPLHAFDLATIAAPHGAAEVFVRAAKEGETIVTLDGEKRRLTSDMIVIADTNGPIALAGVMGGFETEVVAKTTDILLESATFSPAHTSRTSRNLGLISEASLRYERGVDAASTEQNAAYAAALIAEICGGEVCAGAIDVYPSPIAPRTLELRPERLDALVGTSISKDFTVGVLERLGCRVEGEDPLAITVPTFRPDLEREVDLIEEVLRIWGMERVPAQLPGGRKRIGGLSAEQKWLKRIGEDMRAAGLNETMTYAFTSPEVMRKSALSMPKGETAVELINPMTTEQSLMRRYILPELLASVAYNQSHGTKNVQLYDIGTVFAGRTGQAQPDEHMVLSGVLAGKWNDDSWNDKPPVLDFFDGKGVLGDLMSDLGVTSFQVRAAELSHLQPGRSAEVYVRNKAIGWLGEVHPTVLDVFEIDGAVVTFEIDVEPLVAAAQEVRPYREIPRYPSAQIDIALIVDERVTARELQDAIRSAGGKLLSGIKLFDMYQNEEMRDARERSLALTLTFVAPDRTLTNEEVENMRERILGKIAHKFGARLRS